MGEDRDRPRAPGAPRTRRQWIAELLRERDVGFEELRIQLQVPVRELEADLRHVERSERAAARRLRVTPARCRDCGYEFRGRTARHLRPPARCPRCRSEWIEDPRFRLEPAARRPRPR